MVSYCWINGPDDVGEGCAAGEFVIFKKAVWFTNLSSKVLEVNPMYHLLSSSVFTVHL